MAEVITKEATKDYWTELSRSTRENWRRGENSLAARDSKPRRARIDTRATPAFSNLQNFSKSYSNLLEKDFSSFSK
jgi:hypothetical protein